MFRIISFLSVAFILAGFSFSGRNTGHDPETHIIEIRQMKFEPQHITVVRGDTVRWINKDIFPHDVAETENRVWRSDVLQRGESFAVQIEDTVSYFCTLHPVMQGSISIADP